MQAFQKGLLAPSTRGSSHPGALVPAGSDLLSAGQKLEPVGVNKTGLHSVVQTHFLYLLQVLWKRERPWEECKVHTRIKRIGSEERHPCGQ